MSGNYPDGVSASHPYFNPAPERATTVECGADEALVVPSFFVKDAFRGLLRLAENADDSYLVAKLEVLIEKVEELEQEREYECPFNDEIDLEESECARWDCPVCGNERETDTMPEERDPDEEWERCNER